MSQFFPISEPYIWIDRLFYNREELELITHNNFTVNLAF